MIGQWVWSELSPAQAEGLACVICGGNFLREGLMCVPVGCCNTGSQVFACSGSCAHRVRELARAFLIVIAEPLGDSPPGLGEVFPNAVGADPARLRAALRWNAAECAAQAAAVELLIAHGCWLARDVVLRRIRCWPGDDDGPAHAAVDWAALSGVLDSSELGRATASQRLVLAVAVSLAGAYWVSLAGLASCDRVTVGLIADAIRAAGGAR